MEFKKVFDGNWPEGERKINKRGKRYSIFGKRCKIELGSWG